MSQPTTDILGELRTEQFDLFEAAKAVDVAYEVVNAPLEELGERGIPRTLKKANAAVHVYPVKGRYSLPMRRLFNALLALGHAKIKLMPAGTAEQAVANQQVIRFEASGADIKKLIGWEHSGDYEGLYEMLGALQTLQVKWDVLSADGESWTKNTTMLSQWERSSSGKVAWAWMPDLFGLLFDPDNPFTPLDLELTRKFNSKYTLALYENCFRYRKIHYTPWRPTRDWVLLIAGPDLYKDYREFKRTALKKAIEELAKTPACGIVVELEEARGMFNRVEKIRFKVLPKPQGSLGLDLPAAVNTALITKLKKIGVAETAIRKLLIEYDDAYLESQLELTLRESSKSKVKNLAGFFVRAVEERYQDEITKTEEKTRQLIEERRQQEAASQYENDFTAHKKAVALQWFNVQTSENQDKLLAEFIEGASSVVKDRYNKDGIRSKLVEVSFVSWLCQQDDLAHRLDIKDLAGYLASKGHRIGT